MSGQMSIVIVTGFAPRLQRRAEPRERTSTDIPARRPGDWCGRRDLNPHGVAPKGLSPVIDVDFTDFLGNMSHLCRAYE